MLKKDTDWSTLYKNAIGKFRITNVDVGDSENFAIDWTLINEQMINLVNDLNYKREFSIDDIAEFHCRFEKIHPFQDGNGRIGRMIILKQCIKNNISLFFVNKNTREEYINCLRMYHKTLSPLFLSEYFKKQQVIFIERYYKFLYDVNKYASKIIDYIGLNKFINRIQVEKILDVKKSTAGNILKSMVDKKIIKKIGDSSNTEYTF
ncbi:hypothetical protein FACS189459_0320 [Bacilli bacterium]|nr:hypothetical protein FACS189459_0320 [Bacilli bacterium]